MGTITTWRANGIRRFQSSKAILPLSSHRHDDTKLDWTELNLSKCGPMPNLMVALPNIGGSLCSTPRSLADAHYLTAVQ